jgi:Uma2 family endonuclease
MTTRTAPVDVAVEPRRFTSDEVQAMLEAGILHEDDRLELIDGQLLTMAPIGDPHIACINRLNYELNKRLITQDIDDVRVSVQNPVRIDAHNEPEPDVVLTTALDGGPRPDDVLLLVEVAASSLAYDRTLKLPLYAEAGIPEVWIVNLEEQQVEVHRAPSGSAYRTRHLAAPGDRLTVEARPSIDAVPVEALFGAAD